MTSVRVNPVFTFILDSGVMQSQLSNQLPNELPEPIVVTKVLESIVSELESLKSFTDRPGLVELHGALLLFALDGRVELLPSVGFPIGRRSILEARVVWSARRLAGLTKSPNAAAALNRAAERIEELLFIIDPDLVSSAA